MLDGNAEENNLLSRKKFSEAKSKKALGREVTSMEADGNSGGWGHLFLSWRLDLFNSSGLPMAGRRQSHSLEKGGKSAEWKTFLAKE